MVKKGVWRGGTSAWGAAVESGGRGPDAEPSGGSVTLEATGWGDADPEASLRGPASAGARWGWGAKEVHGAGLTRRRVSVGQCRRYRGLAQIGPIQRQAKCTK